MQQTVAIIANGKIESPDLIRPLILRHSRFIAVDGGLVHCKKMNIRPHVIVGDFDSCPPEILEEYSDVSKISLKNNQDETDLEVAIQEIGPKQVTLYGAWGNRIDHSLTHILLLTRYPGMKIETENEILFAVEGKISLDCFEGQTLSLIPVNGAVSGVSTKGLKWELDEKTLDQNLISISNIALNKRVEISLKSGSLICCLNKFKIGS